MTARHRSLASFDAPRGSPTRPSKRWLVNRRWVEDELDPYQRVASAVIRDAMYEVVDPLAYLRSPCAVFWVRLLGSDPIAIWAVATQNMEPKPGTPDFDAIPVTWQRSPYAGIEEVAGCRIPGHAAVIEIARRRAARGVIAVEDK